jgi:CRP-like cAMP-binding protein
MMPVQPIELINQRLHQEVKKYGQVLQFEKKALLFSPEELQKKFFFIQEGRIKVSQINLEDGKEQTLKILTSGDMYDVVTLLDGKVHDNILEALDDVKVIVFPISVVRSWMTEDTQFNQLIFPYIAQQFRDMEELALDLSFYDTSKRLLKLISKNIPRENSPKPSLIHDLPHEELAALIGTVRKVLNRHIQKLKKDGIIDVTRKNIEIKDTQKLIDNLPFL